MNARDIVKTNILFVYSVLNARCFMCEYTNNMTHGVLAMGVILAVAMAVFFFSGQRTTKGVSKTSGCDRSECGVDRLAVEHSLMPVSSNEWFTPPTMFAPSSQEQVAPASGATMLEGFAACCGTTS